MIDSAAVALEPTASSRTFFKRSGWLSWFENRPISSKTPLQSATALIKAVPGRNVHQSFCTEVNAVAWASIFAREIGDLSFERFTGAAAALV